MYDSTKFHIHSYSSSPIETLKIHFTWPWLPCYFHSMHVFQSFITQYFRTIH